MEQVVKLFREDRHREAWRAWRVQMELKQIKFTPVGTYRQRRCLRVKDLIPVFGVALRLCGLYERGVRNTLDIRLRQLELRFQNLPQNFDGFRILQITDLHIGLSPSPIERAFDLIASVDCDLCVLTGDYRRGMAGPFDHIMPTMAELVTRISAADGICAVLGNHDCADMVDAFEGLGIQVLVNETREIRRGNATICLTGTDDVHRYFTEAARAALEGSLNGFKIALIHSAELADVAADSGYSLYLAGHTHGGQVCLPGGIPIITNMTRLRRYASGLWQHGSMTGYTSAGIGTSTLPVRFNTCGEVTLIVLRLA